MVLFAIVFFIATCLFSKNVCALLCGNTEDERKDALEKLYNGENVGFNTNCPRVIRLLNVDIPFPSSVSTRDSNCTFTSTILI